MIIRLGRFLRLLPVILALGMPAVAAASAGTSWQGKLRDDAGEPVGAATIRLSSAAGDKSYTSVTSATGDFIVPDVVPGEYKLFIEAAGKAWSLPTPIAIRDKAPPVRLQLSSQAGEVRIVP